MLTLCDPSDNLLRWLYFIAPTLQVCISDSGQWRDLLELTLHVKPGVLAPGSVFLTAAVCISLSGRVWRLACGRTTPTTVQALEAGSDCPRDGHAGSRCLCRLSRLGKWIKIPPMWDFASCGG